MSSRSRTPVIIDTDPGCDDILAILLAIASPEIEILAYIVTFGNTDIDHAYLNILKVHQAISRHLQLYPDEASRFPNFSTTHKPFLVRGSDGPIGGEKHLAEYFHGRDGLGDVTSRHPEHNVEWTAGCNTHPQLRPVESPAPAFAIDLLRSHPIRAVTYIALGPLTTLAQIIGRDRAEFNSRIGRIVSMGGALDVPGNTTPVAEFNYYADPYAVRRVLSPTEGVPLDRFIMCPLDITTQHQLRFVEHYQASVDPALSLASKTPSVAQGKTPLVHFTSSYLEFSREIMLQWGNDAMELHDIVAMWCAIENPPVLDEEQNASGESPLVKSDWVVSQKHFQIERTGEITRGMLVVDRRSDEGTYDPGANRTQVQNLPFEKHNPGKTKSAAVNPALVEISIEDREKQLAQTGKGAGVACVSETPGAGALVTLLLKRVWAVDV